MTGPRRPRLAPPAEAAPEVPAGNGNNGVIPMGSKRYRYSLTREARQKKIDERIRQLEEQRWDTEISLAGLNGQLEVMREDDKQRQNVLDQIKLLAESLTHAEHAITAISDLPVR